ncbi:MAG: dihydropteroate synthase [Lachnospiraceae bacterium]|nr:dihydropteroate synthase [Lachnospiraceae bacterium]
MQIGNKQFDVKNETYIMGILNVTPDSFSDGGKFNTLDAALFHAEEMIRDGAAIVDVGGESTRPGYQKISDEEEIERVCPVIEGIRSRLDTVISIDTYKSAVAKAALASGADIVNDVWGFKADPEIANVTAKAGAACILMHNKAEAVYNNFMEDMKQELRESIAIAKAAGVQDDRIIVDPGVGFGKSYENNLEAIAQVQQLKELGYPVLLATSRKSVIGLTLDLPSDQRVEGTLVTSVYGVQKGCAFVRVHDIKENARAIAMTKALMRF